MAVNVYVNFNGSCREAVEYYADIFKTNKPQFVTFGDMAKEHGYPMPEEAKEYIMHTNLDICGSKVMFSDIFPGTPFTIGNNISLAVETDDLEIIKKAFQRISEQGQVEMELQQTQWSQCYGSVIDRFGVVWQFNYESK